MNMKPSDLMEHESQSCPKCASNSGPLQRFCWKCGTDLLTGDTDRTRQFASHPGESVFSLNLITSIMPHASGNAPQVFRFALLTAVATPIFLTLTGFLAIGLVSAVVSVPILYLFYFYDANEWEDQPILVVSIIMGVSAVLGISAQIIQDVLVDSDPIRSMSQGRFDSSELLVGIVAAASTILLAQVGPVILARLPKFDDLIDGLTFGVAAGSAFAAGESLTTSWKFVATTGLRTPSNDTLLWLVKVLELGLLRPIIIGTAVGLVVAAFAGIGDGPGRLNSNYVRTNLTSFGLLVVWQFGYLVIDRVADGGARSLIGLAWASIVAALLILRLRFVLHVALIEAASEAAARGSALQSANKGIGFCPECSMPLMDGANFCSSCGTSVRAHSKLSRRDIVTFVSAS
jgi:hypothetical protein